MRQIKFREWRGKKFHYFGFVDGGFKGPVNISSIVEQFTGLKDKNGKEIYESDVLKSCDDGLNGLKFYYIVEWGHHGWSVRHYQSKRRASVVSNYFFAKCEVIGNIHTPETLNKKI